MIWLTIFTGTWWRLRPPTACAAKAARNALPGWKAFADAARIHHWQETDPVIHVYGDAAVVAYYFDISFDMNGQTIHSDGRDMFFMVREEGLWWVVGDQFSSFPG